ncbi:MAG: DNA (cytosine-5-)-methyltransferase [Roseiflexaceae bacterium]
MNQFLDIRTIRKGAGLRLRDLAKLAGVSHSELSKCERGLVLPNDDFFASVAEVLGVDASKLQELQSRLLKTIIPGEGYVTAKALRRLVKDRKSEYSKSSIKVMDLFCGIGGLSHGFEQTGQFQVTLGLDLLEDRVLTFCENHPMATAIVDNIQNVDFESLANAGPLPDIIIGGPPCQGFSSIRPFRALTENDPRNNLFESFALIVNTFKPKWFVLENVVGLLTHKQGETLRIMLQLFQQIGYTVDWKVLNAALYGLPQRRERLIIVGNSEGKTFYWPEPSHFFYGRSMAGKNYGQTIDSLPLFGNQLSPAVTVMEAIHDLPPIKAGESSDKYKEDVDLTSYEKMMRRNSKVLTLHEATKHSDHMLDIIRNAGYNRSALPEGMTTSGFSSSYSRIEPDLPSVTLTVNFVHPASNKCIHPFQDRALTPREGARLQGFEDDYVFRGSRAQIVKQIGNAVPPLLGKVIAEALLKHI